MAVAVIAILQLAAWVCAPVPLQHAVAWHPAARARLRLVTAAPSPEPEKEDGGVFEDFERECFGDEDGCDAWFYGENPEEEARSESIAPERVAALQADGQASREQRRMREAQTQAVLERLRGIAAQG
mmetsp:Transcript_30575/g.71103  ORF Transcript_30575/g.71103 Transcript_30575/m.71103 type:complete len:127 (-) Transcript_30575:258-638(-)